MSKIPWHIKILLLFRKTHVAVDLGTKSDKTCIIYYKYLFDKMYIVKEQYEDSI